MIYNRIDEIDEIYKRIDEIKFSNKGLFWNLFILYFVCIIIMNNNNNHSKLYNTIIVVNKRNGMSYNIYIYKCIPIVTLIYFNWIYHFINLAYPIWKGI